MTLDFFDWTRHELEAYCQTGGFSTVHAQNLFRHVYKGGQASVSETPRLPRNLAHSLETTVSAEGPAVASEHRSRYDLSVKLLCRLGDGALVETVIMPEKKRMTLCLSTQVGCRQGCVFCHTGRMGLVRHLTVGEIVGQLWLANRWIAEHPEWLAATGLPSGMRVTNVVFMGMGEPLDNVEAVIGSIDVMTDPYGFGLGPRRISVSTAGHLDGLQELASRRPKVRLALSVHTTDERKRSRLMPINRRWPLSRVVGYLRELTEPDGRPILLQYTLISGVNDSLEEARKLVFLTKGWNAKVNLIPLNEVEPSRLEAPDPGRVQAFRDHLHQNGVRVMVRYSKGQDIEAACGQLIAEG